MQDRMKGNDTEHRKRPQKQGDVQRERTTEQGSTISLEWTV